MQAEGRRNGGQCAGWCKCSYLTIGIAAGVGHLCQSEEPHTREGGPHHALHTYESYNIHGIIRDTHMSMLCVLHAYTHTGAHHSWLHKHILRAYYTIYELSPSHDARLHA